MPVLEREFADRDALVAYCRTQFPDAAAIDTHVSPIIGGRAEAKRRLSAIDPPRYAATRNHVDGAVSRLSPFLRHGVLSLAEARDAALRSVQDPSKAGKFVNELAWRDYWRRVLDELGDGVREDLEPHKTGLDADDYADELPADLAAGDTGIDFIDDWIAELYATGYLHNQARMKLASYVVHGRRVHWRVGADWFLSHLLDGDLASNHLSWQWVASTFSAKPYVFNLEGLRACFGEHYEGRTRDGQCPFSGTNDDVAARWFPGGGR